MLTSVSSQVRPRRTGFTLVEMLVALSIAGVVLALVAAITVREQRVFGDLAERAATAGQLREAAVVVPIGLRALSPASGDIRAAADTALELRVTIGSGVVCDTAPGALVLPPASMGPPYASFLMAPSAGDTAWLLTASDSGDRWQPRAVTDAASASPGRCAAGGPALDALSAAAARTRLSLGGSVGAAGIVAGTPVRLTRALRFSLYLASDGGWYLGERDWNAAQLRFNTIQPVAGPFLPAASGLRFTYRDSAGGVVPTPLATTTLVRSIEVALHAQTRRRVQILGTTGASRADSARVVIALRNR